jgi:hypothetical protein
LRKLRGIRDKSARQIVAAGGQLRVITALLMAARTPVRLAARLARQMQNDRLTRPNRCEPSISIHASVSH